MENDTRADSYLIHDVQRLYATIRNNEGKPIYIVDDKEQALALVLEGVDNIFISSEAHAHLTYDLQEPVTITHFGKPLEAKDTDSPVIILTARDIKGDQITSKVYDILKKANVTVYIQDAKDGFKAITVGGKEAVKREILSQYQSVHSVGGNIKEFNEMLSSNVNTPPIPTGFDTLDKALDDGLYEGLYAVGAISSLGKTTFCLNIADQIAHNGQDVIIISLEMSKYELMSKSISRLTFNQYLSDPERVNYNWCKTARGITAVNRYSSYSKEEIALIYKARDMYANDVGQHLYIYEGVGDMTVQTIEDIVKKHIAYTGNRPVVIVDYLQLLQHKDKYINANDKMRTDANLTAIKRLSRDTKTAIIVISSFNRTNYNTEVCFEAFKESGAIEYTCDVVMGLQLAGVGTTSFDVNKAKGSDPREIELKILKNRQAKVGGVIKYYYYPKFNHYQEADEQENI